MARLRETVVTGQEEMPERLRRFAADEWEVPPQPPGWDGSTDGWRLFKARLMWTYAALEWRRKHRETRRTE